jgi:hypothetical protein
MPPKKNLIWLASYPKSGNTWIRLLLSNYLNKENKLIGINDIDSSIISSSRTIFDSFTPFLSSDLDYEEIDNLRPEIYKSISKENDDCVFVKTPVAFTQNNNKEDNFPLSVTKAVIHIVRNPLDVATSYSHHSNISIEKSISSLNKELSLSASSKHLNPQLRQKILTWSSHYLSWKNVSDKYILVKYEDLIKDPVNVFSQIIKHIYKEVDEQKIINSVKQSSFKKLKEQEESGNFKERAVHSKAFFRKGRIGTWKEEMSDEQAQKIINKHSKIMEELGYLDN